MHGRPLWLEKFKRFSQGFVAEDNNLLSEKNKELIKIISNSIQIQYKCKIESEIEIEFQ
jgi:hypothetical protein